jgi:UDP-N-acetylglucosamine--N-acetylmuramyl-(pentapeptide) pyrophosphoryl-undecaprenol N-acetylglucosamine transferase
MRALLVASSGGHMVQLESWSRRIAGIDKITWAAAESPQSKTLLAGQDVHWIPDIQPRQLRETMSLLGVARRIVREEQVDVVVSTGASVAIPFFMAARMYGAEGHYIESAARVEGPSISGQVAAVMPKVRCYTQSRSWADSRWTYAGSVFDGYQGREVEAPAGPLRVVVTVGSMHHPMTRLLEQLNAVLPEGAEVVWQLGHTPAIPGMRADRIEEFITHDELTDLMREAHVVVCHAGVGSALQAMSVGKAPILVPRLIEHGEHVDDHQEQIAKRLGDLGLAMPVYAENLTADVIRGAATRAVGNAASPSPLVLRLGRAGRVVRRSHRGHQGPSASGEQTVEPVRRTA